MVPANTPKGTQYLENLYQAEDRKQDPAETDHKSALAALGLPVPKRRIVMDCLVLALI
jgi:hypothetical protein